MTKDNSETNPAWLNSRMTVGIVGAGPVGIALGQALAGAGHLLSGVYAISPESWDRMVERLPGVPVLPIRALMEACDLVVVAIPPRQLPTAITSWANAGYVREGQIIVHTAAEHGLEVLAPAVAQGAIPIAIHPAMRFAGTDLDLKRIRESYFAVTAPEAALPIGQLLVMEMGAEPVVIPEADRDKYAEAVSVASSFSGLVVNQSVGLLREIGVVPAREILGPLIHGSVDIALAKGYVDTWPEDFEG